MTIVSEHTQVTARIEYVGGQLARYGLVVVIGWIGLMKFTAFEAQGIQPLVADSPLMSWLDDVFSVNTFSALLGVVEVAAAVLLAVAPWWPRISAAGSVISIGLFVATLSFMFTTPGVFEASQGGFPMLSSTGHVSDQGRGAAGDFGVDAR